LLVTLAKREPAVIKRVNRSAELLARQLIAHASFKPNYVKDYIIEQGLGITDATDDEIAYLEKWQEKNLTSNNIEEHLANMVSVRALIGVSHCTMSSLQEKKVLTSNEFFVLVDNPWSHSC
jgi:hypothetical protein